MYFKIWGKIKDFNRSSKKTISFHNDMSNKVNRSHLLLTILLEKDK